MQYAYGSLSTDPLGKKRYPQLHGRALQSSAPSLYAIFSVMVGQERFASALEQVSSNLKIKFLYL